MIWLIGFSICILLLLGDRAAESPLPDPFWTCSLVLLATIAPSVVACIQSRLVSVRWRGTCDRAKVVPGIFRRIVVSNYLFWLGSSAAIMLVLDWPQLVRGTWLPGNFPLIDEIVIAFPVIVSAALSCFVIYSAVPMCISSRSGVPEPNRPGVATALGQLRLLAGLVFVPVMILFLIRDLVTMFLPPEYLSLAFGIGGALFFVLLTGLYPIIAATTWRTGDLPCQSFQDDLRRTAIERGMRPIPVLLWHTNDLVVNAVVVGLLPGTRRVFLTDGLLQHFEHREVLAIFRHELGHIAGRHLWIRLSLLVLPILILSFLSSGLAPGLRVEFAWNTGLIAIALLGLWCFVSVLVFRSCEISADRFAQLDSDGNFDSELAEDYCSALLKIALVNPESWSRGTMIHPSIRTRIEAVSARAGIDPLGELGPACPLEI